VARYIAGNEALSTPPLLPFSHHLASLLVPIFAEAALLRFPFSTAQLRKLSARLAPVMLHYIPSDSAKVRKSRE
jgi:hypothetical protein